MALSRDKIDRLKKLARMLEGEHEGEVVNAARLITRILREDKLDFSDLVERAFAAPNSTSGRPSAPEPSTTYTDYGRPASAKRYATWKGVKAWDLIKFAQAQGGRANNFEQNYLASLSAFGPRVALTEKQWIVLWRIGINVGAISDAA
jgi:hypothetical protein